MNNAVNSVLKVVIALGILAVLAATNPTKTDYTDWLTTKMATEGRNPLQVAVTSLIGDRLISNVTTRTDYLLFSVYNAKIDNSTYKAVGILHNFIPLKS